LESRANGEQKYSRRKVYFYWVLVAHAYNPSYSGGSDQEGRGSEPALADSSVRPCLEKTHHKKGTGGVTQGVDPEFKPQYWKKKKLGGGA
jgi:hypothetical protein